MDINEENEIMLTKEYIKVFERLWFWSLKVVGFARFDIMDNEIVELRRNSQAYNMLLLCITNLAVGYLSYCTFIPKALKISDFLFILHCACFANSMIVNMTFINKQGGLNVLRCRFKIDSYFGVKDTKFLRKMELITYSVILGILFFSNVIVGIFLWQMFDVSMAIHLIGSGYFFWVFFIFDDYCYSALNIISLALRTRYLNVALARATGLDVVYLSDRSVLNLVFWWKRYDDYVTFHCKASLEDYRKAYEMLFEMKRAIEVLFRFALFYGFWLVAVGTFFTSQVLIDRFKSRNILNTSDYLTVGWTIFSWGLTIGLTVVIELFQQEIEQTRLICVCIQLKPNKPREVYKMTNTLLHFLKMREPRLSIYSLFYKDTGFVLRMMAATFVYITVQLQLAFPKLPKYFTSNNNTSLVNHSLSKF